MWIKTNKEFFRLENISEFVLKSAINTNSNEGRTALYVKTYGDDSLKEIYNNFESETKAIYFIEVMIKMIAEMEKHDMIYGEFFFRFNGKNIAQYASDSNFIYLEEVLNIYNECDDIHDFYWELDADFSK